MPLGNVKFLGIPVIVTCLLDRVTLPLIQESLGVVARLPSLPQSRWLASDSHMLGAR